MKLVVEAAGGRFYSAETAAVLLWQVGGFAGWSVFGIVAESGQSKEKLTGKQSSLGCFWVAYHRFGLSAVELGDKICYTTSDCSVPLLPVFLSV